MPPPIGVNSHFVVNAAAEFSVAIASALQKSRGNFALKTAMAVFDPIGLPIEFWSYKRLLREVLLDQDTTIAWYMVQAKWAACDPSNLSQM